MSEDQFTKISDRIAQGFDGVNNKLSEHDKSFVEFFKNMEAMRSDMNKRFDIQDKKIDELAGAIAELGGQLRDYHQEMIMLARKVDRMERWIHEIAKQTGVTLSFE
jgi:uncharacterized coiled-coil protein SlyX